MFNLNFKIMPRIYPSNWEELPEEYYTPSDSMEKYDPETGIFYNFCGQRLRSPKQYNPMSEGYTPFGDE